MVGSVTIFSYEQAFEVVSFFAVRSKADSYGSSSEGCFSSCAVGFSS